MSSMTAFLMSGLALRDSSSYERDEDKGSSLHFLILARVCQTLPLTASGTPTGGYWSKDGIIINRLNSVDIV